ncbi:MAG: SpoIIE family protein phosphatase [Pseudomonadota bacterium]
MTLPDTHPDRATVEAQLAELARRYREQLPTKFDEIAEAWNALQSEWHRETAEVLHRVAHGIAGAAGTMGLPQVGEAARAVEQVVKQLLAEPASLGRMGGRLTSLITELDVAIRHGGGAHAAAPDQGMPLVVAPMKILVADDEHIGRTMLAAMLRADGHTVVVAEDGEQAVALFEQAQPDLVLMDVVMPRMDGYAAARAIKARCGKRFVPLIFLTALHDEQDLLACIQAGGDDFMIKPYNRTLLRAKLIAMQRIHELHRELARYQERTEEELALSRHVFYAATDRNAPSPAVVNWYASVGHFCGDLVLHAYSPSGRLFVLQGDFTGHGLAAALGALPVSDMFYAMVDKESSLSELVTAINRKLKAALPPGHFCAACVCALDGDGTTLELWNGGLPGAWLLDADNRVAVRVESDKMPLGIVGDQAFDASILRLPLVPDARLLLFSDGLSEVANAAGEMLGEAGIAASVQAAAGGDLLAALREAVEVHLAGGEAHDDISITVIDPALVRPAR